MAAAAVAVEDEAMAPLSSPTLQSAAESWMEGSGGRRCCWAEEDDGEGLAMVYV